MMQEEEKSDWNKYKTDVEIYNFLSHDGQVKLVKNPVPFMPNLQLIDISIKGKGPLEDKILTKNIELRKYVRRGLSFLEESRSDAIMSRKGLEKFFDLKYEYIQLGKGILTTDWLKHKKDEKNLYYSIFKEVNRTFKNGHSIHIYKTLKANGENTQIAYLKQHDAWIISSKNVSILVRDEKDISSYEATQLPRYQFAIEMARVWLSKIAKIAKDPEKLQELKNDLDGYNIIGEYVGNPLHQHLIEYKEIDIMFYALVDLRGEDASNSCCPVARALSFFKKYNLNHVKIESRGVYKNPVDFFTTLEKIFAEVSSSSLDADEEGSVLYFEENTDAGKAHILSLCKLKTLEYRLYRKLREKLKNFMRRQMDKTKVLSTYNSEIKELCKKYSPPENLEHYSEVARIALKFISTYGGSQKSIDLSNRFLDFLKIILDCKQKNIEPTFEMFKNLKPAEKDIFSDPEEDDNEEDKVEDSAMTIENPKKVESPKTESTIEKAPKTELMSEKALKIELTNEKAPANKMEIEETKSQVDTNKRVVIIAPPLYIEGEILEKIKEEFKLKEIETEWRDARPLFGKHNVALINMVPRIEKMEKLGKSTYFMILGFDKKNLNTSIDKLFMIPESGITHLKPGEVYFKKSKDIEGAIKTFFGKIDGLKTFLRDNLPNNYLVIDNLSDDNLDLKFTKLKDLISNGFSSLQGEQFGVVDQSKISKIPQQKVQVSTKKNVLMLIPLGIPAMGKTTFLNTFKQVLEKYDCDISIISSDQVRKEIIDDLAIKYPHYDQQKLFDQSTKPSKKKFDDMLESLFNKSGALPKSNHLIFLDKNHPPKHGVPAAVELIQGFKHFSKYNVKLIGVLPLCLNRFKIEKAEFPFSLTFLLNCISRGMNRKYHETLVGDDHKVTGIIIMFANLFRNFRFNENSMKGFGLDGYIQLPFTYEEKDSDDKIPESIREKLAKILKDLKPGQYPEDKLLTDFIRELKAANLEFKYPDPSVLYEYSIKSLNECFKLFE